MHDNFVCFLKRKYKEYLNYAQKVSNGTILAIMIVSSFVFVTILAFESIVTPDAFAANPNRGKYAEVQTADDTEIIETTTMTEEKTTQTETSTTSLTTTTTTTTAEVTTTTAVTSEITEQNESVTEVVPCEVGQYGYAIDPNEYVYLAEVIEHEGGNCPVSVKEHIGICLLNRVFTSGFSDTVYGCKEQCGQYFSGDYYYGDESAEIAKTMIDAYNSGSDYWCQYCQERGLTCQTKYQRNDYCVPGTQYVNDDYTCTSGGFWFHMYYSE